MIWGLCEQLSEKERIENKDEFNVVKDEKKFILKNRSLLGRKFELLYRLMISPTVVKYFYKIL